MERNTDVSRSAIVPAVDQLSSLVSPARRLPPERLLPRLISRIAVCFKAILLLELKQHLDGPSPSEAKTRQFGLRGPKN